MLRFKTKEIDCYYAANSILNFIDYAESNLHSIGRYNGSLSLYRKCLYIKRQDSLFYKYGEDVNGDVQKLKQFMRKCCREIDLWKKDVHGIDRMRQ